MLRGRAATPVLWRLRCLLRTPALRLCLAAAGCWCGLLLRMCPAARARGSLRLLLLCLCVLRELACCGSSLSGVLRRAAGARVLCWRCLLRCAGARWRCGLLWMRLATMLREIGRAHV